MESWSRVRNVSHHSPDAPKTEGARAVGTHRVLAILVKLAGYPEGVSLDEMSRLLDSPKSTVHRGLAALRDLGLAAQDGRGRYLLGDEFLRLAFANHEARPDHLRIRPVLLRLVERCNETAHYAVLLDREVVYRAKIDPPSGAVRLTSTVGGRNPAHSTAVGKVLLAHALRDDAAVRRWVDAGAVVRRTDHTITGAAELCAELARVRERGFAVDDQENELGVNCVAVPVFLASPTVPSGAVSVSGLTYRTPLQDLVEQIEQIRKIVATV